MTVRPKINPRHFITTNAVELAPLSLLMKQFLDAECETELTLRAYRSDLDILIRYVSHECVTPPQFVIWGHLDKALLCLFRDERVEMEKPATVERRISVIKRFCRWTALRHGIEDPAAKVGRVDVPQAGFLGMRDADLQRFREVSRAQVHPVHRFAPLLLLGTGLRCSEACGLTMRQVMPEMDWLTNILGKGRKYRSVPLQTDLRAEFQIYLFWRERFPCGKDSPLLLAPRSVNSGKIVHMCPKTLWALVNRLGDAIGTRVHPHMLRHTFAYLWLAAQANKDVRDLVRLGKILGHANIETTLRYLGQDEKDVWESVQRMSA